MVNSRYTFKGSQRAAEDDEHSNSGGDSDDHISMVTSKLKQADGKSAQYNSLVGDIVEVNLQ